MTIKLNDNIFMISIVSGARVTRPTGVLINSLHIPKGFVYWQTEQDIWSSIGQVA